MRKFTVIALAFLLMVGGYGLAQNPEMNLSGDPGVTEHWGGGWGRGDGHWGDYGYHGGYHGGYYGGNYGGNR